MSEEKTAAQAAADETAEAKSPFVVAFKKPYTFEKNEYTEVDLSRLEDLKIKDLADVQKKLMKNGDVASSLIMETTAAFTCEMAARASGKPIEFFKRMPVKTFDAVQTAVTKAINSEAESEDAHVMKLEAPYIYMGQRKDINGQTFSEVQFDNASGISAADKAAAENRMAATGQPVTGNPRNYVYACCIAARASFMPEDFFMGLPVCEGLKLLNILNSDAFFE